MNITDEPKTISYGNRGDDFKNLISKILKMGKLKQKYIDILTSDSNMILYGHAFTSANVDPVNNYEFYEILGDSTLGNFLIYYCSRRFPELQNAAGVSILSKMKATYGQKEFLAQIAGRMNYFEFISATQEDKMRIKNSLLEDCFESFIGVTVYILDKEIMNGVGYAIAYDILKEIYDVIDINPNFEELQDSISKLKEFFDPPHYRNLGKIEYRNEVISSDSTNRIVKSTVVFLFKTGRQMVLGEGTASIKKKADNKAATEALSFLKKSGFTKDKPF